jgi:hypothetical protein
VSIPLFLKKKLLEILPSFQYHKIEGKKKSPGFTFFQNLGAFLFNDL